MLNQVKKLLRRASRKTCPPSTLDAVSLLGPRYYFTAVELVLQCEEICLARDGVDWATIGAITMEGRVSRCARVCDLINSFGTLNERERFKWSCHIVQGRGSDAENASDSD